MTEPLLTRKQSVQFIREKTGIPVTESRIEKAAMIGEGPAPAARYGNSFLYEPQAVLAWARGLISPAEAA